ncbi:MAG: hypothetical protein Q9218_008141 [Villophora microphyllina]
MVRHLDRKRRSLKTGLVGLFARVNDVISPARLLRALIGQQALLSHNTVPHRFTRIEAHEMFFSFTSLTSFVAPISYLLQPIIDHMAPIPKRGGRKNKTKGKRWTGGPALARHIPWPEIFKHHISNIEGHFRMLDMVRKHTREGSGSYRTVCEMIDRTNEILQQSKSAARSFVPPANQIDSVPLGSSSDSMYPGYSPADIEYGKASEEYGNYAADAKKRGVDVVPEVDYTVGQSKGQSRMTLAQMQAAKRLQNGLSSSPGKRPHANTSEEEKVGDEGDKAGSAKPSSVASEQMFFMDSKPTPVNLSSHTPPSLRKRRPSTDHIDPATSNPSKKSKKNHIDEAPAINADNATSPKKHNEKSSNATTNHPDGDTPISTPYPTEDISEEVDRRMKLKEEKRKRRQVSSDDRKRKRDSEASASGPVAAQPDFPNPEKKRAKQSVKTTVGEGAGAKRKRDSNASAAADTVEPVSPKAKTKDSKLEKSSPNYIASEDAPKTTEQRPKKKPKVKTSPKSPEDSKRHSLPPVETGEKPAAKTRTGDDGLGKAVSEGENERKPGVEGDGVVEAEAEGKGKKKKRRTS